MSILVEQASHNMSRPALAGAPHAGASEHCEAAADPTAFVALSISHSLCIHPLRQFASRACDEAKPAAAPKPSLAKEVLVVLFNVVVDFLRQSPRTEVRC